MWKVGFFILFASVQQSCALPLVDRFKQVGYVEMCNEKHGAETFDRLYAYFDEFIDFLQANQVWMQKLYCAKERFIRSADRAYYATDFFGFYDESKREGRNQVSFYYSILFHDFICSRFSEFNKVPEIMRFFESCREIQQAYESLFVEASVELGSDVFSSKKGVPILFKVIKYFPSYCATRPHYDGTALSLFLDSTDTASLMLSPYKSTFTVEDFSSPLRMFSREHKQNSMVLIPGTQLKEFGVYPTPHIVVQSGKVRYATIAFAMRPDYIFQKNDFSALPNFKH